MSSVLLGCVPFAVILFILIWTTLTQSIPTGQLRHCESNLKQISGALEKYRAKHQGLYPRQLDQLVSDGELRSLPTCPAAGRLTYADRPCSIDGKSYEFGCNGINHNLAYQRTAGCDLPRCSSSLGDLP